MRTDCVPIAIRVIHAMELFKRLSIATARVPTGKLRHVAIRTQRLGVLLRGRWTLYSAYPRHGPYAFAL